MRKSIIIAVLTFIIESIAAAEEMPRRITFVCPLLGNEFWESCYAGMQAADQACGTNTRMIGTENADTDEIARLIDMSVASKVDGILLPIDDSEAVANAVARAVDAGIPVIAVESDGANSKSTAYVGIDPYASGYQAGLAMLDGAGNDARIGMVQPTITFSKIEEEIRGFNDAVTSAGAIIVAIEETDSSALDAMGKVGRLLDVHLEVNALFCLTANDGPAAAKIIEERGLEGITLVCHDDLEDTLEYIRKGIVYATVAQDPYNSGYEGVHMLSAVLSGEDAQDVLLETTIVTRDNIDSYRQGIAP